MYFLHFKVATDQKKFPTDASMVSVVLTVAKPYVQNLTIVLVTVSV